MEDAQKPNWAAAYEEELRDLVEEMSAARRDARTSTRTGREAVVYVPSKQREVRVSQLTDYQIREVAQREAERYTQRAINQHNENR